MRPNTKLFYLESPTTFSFQLQDLRAVAQLARANKIKTVIDNSWATPYFQNPIEFGVDLVVHRAANISAVTAMSWAAQWLARKPISIIFTSNFSTRRAGAICESYSAARTAHATVRLRQHQQNTAEVVNFLADHPQIEAVYYPFHPSHPQYELAQQMRGGSGLLSFTLKPAK